MQSILGSILFCILLAGTAAVAGQARRHIVQNRLTPGAALGAAGWLALAVVLLAVFHSPVWDVHDDMMINWIYSALPVQEYSPFQHPALSWVMWAFYRLLPGLNWFIIGQYAAMGLALWALGYLVLRAWPVYKALPLALLAGAGVLCGGLVRVTFTRTGAICAIAGGLLAVFSLEEAPGRRRMLTLATGVVLYLAGMMYRVESAIIPLPFLLMTAVYRAALPAWPRWGQLLHKALRPASLVCGLAVVALAVQWGGMTYLKAQPGWAEYLRFNDARSRVQDYRGYPDPGSNRELYAQAGLSWAAVDFLFHWGNEDPEVFTTETLEQVAQLRDTALPQGHFAAEGRKLLAECRLIWCTLAAAALVLVLERRRGILPVLGCLSGGAALVCLLILGSRSPTRAVDAAVVCALGALLLMASPAPGAEQAASAGRARWAPAVVGTVLAVLLCVGQAGPFAVPSSGYLRSEEHMALADEMDRAGREGTIYLMPPSCPFTLYDDAGFWMALPRGYCSNLFWLGNWEQRLPAVQAMREARGIQNPMRALTDLPQVVTAFDLRVLNYLQYQYHWYVTATRTPWTGELDRGRYTLPQTAERAAQGSRVELTAVQPDAEPTPADGTRALRLAGTVQGQAAGAYYLNVTLPDGAAYSIALELAQNGAFDQLVYNTPDFVEALEAGSVHLYGQLLPENVMADLGPVMSKAAE